MVLSDQQWNELELIANNKHLLIDDLLRRINGNLLMMNVEDTADVFNCSKDLIKSIKKYFSFQ